MQFFEIGNFKDILDKTIFVYYFNFMASYNGGNFATQFSDLYWFFPLKVRYFDFDKNILNLFILA